MEQIPENAENPVGMATIDLPSAMFSNRSLDLDSIALFGLIRSNNFRSSPELLETLGMTPARLKKAVEKLCPVVGWKTSMVLDGALLTENVDLIRRVCWDYEPF